METKMSESSEMIYNTIREVYTPSSSGLLTMLPLIIFIFTGIITVFYLIRIEINMSTIDWEKNKCIPRYMFISGFIKQEEDLGVLGTINSNFNKCVRKFNTDYNNPLTTTENDLGVVGSDINYVYDKNKKKGKK